MTNATKNNIGLTVKVLVYSATLIVGGWFIDDRMDKQMDRLVFEVDGLKTEIRDLTIKVSRIEGEMKANRRR